MPLNLADSELEGFFTAPDGLFAGSFYLVTNEEVPTATSGIYSIGEQVEERLTLADVQSASRAGIAVYPNRRFGSLPIGESIPPSPGSFRVSATCCSVAGPKWRGREMVSCCSAIGCVRTRSKETSVRHGRISCVNRWNSC
ncbi:MAG: hypothetical protein U5R48_16440 [Gammaproteobacteria bacterium]|nr:hypothetical protein [Gammaproteobacteria bacterium]